MARTGEIAARCSFSLDQLRYEYPSEIAGGEAPGDRLRRLAEEGLAWRYPGGAPDKVRAMMAHELRLIGKLGYEPYFLTVRDVVAFARSRGILCQGRGSAANSVVCYCLGVTSVSPEIGTMVFERFVSEARNEPPDIDVDFEHERREEVIQHIYQRYGRHRAGLCATVIHYRGKRAIREVGRAMGLTDDTIGALSSQLWGFFSTAGLEDHRMREIGLNPEDRRLRQTMALIHEVIGFPRHLSQHVGGFVITEGRLDELCPVENATMEDRTVIPWDKDDIDALGILKVDVLALGMLSCIRKAFDLIARHHRTDYTLATLPPEDPAVYDMLCKADSLGVFQVESRAQMNFLPRMRPRTFYDLVIEVAIIRPGPIQGDMVHPYLRRRNGEEEVSFPSDALGRVLGKTLGVPLFQEQAMQIAITGAGFTAEEADRLRRSLATFKKHGNVSEFRARFLRGMAANGYDRDFAERCFSQIEGFGSYGFPESHAASFALLVYASAWLKRHHPGIFACALLNAQPMGFYAPAQIVRDAREHGVTVRPVCINASYWDNVMEPDGQGGLALRLGFPPDQGPVRGRGAVDRRGPRQRLPVGRGRVAPRGPCAAQPARAGRGRRLRRAGADAARRALGGQGACPRHGAAALRRGHGWRGDLGTRRHPAGDDPRRRGGRGLRRPAPDPSGPSHGAAQGPADAAAGRARRTQPGDTGPRPRRPCGRAGHPRPSARRAAFHLTPEPSRGGGRRHEYFQTEEAGKRAPCPSSVRKYSGGAPPQAGRGAAPPIAGAISATGSEPEARHSHRGPSPPGPGTP